jgi:cupin fold WbuC family metalloprotein
VQLIDRPLIARVLEQARHSPRRRMNHNFHASLEDNPSRFLNVLIRGTYIAPHRHLDPPKPESFLVLEGRLALFVFDDAGQVERCHTLGSGQPALGVDLDPGVWHTIAALSPQVVCFEVKPGPYNSATDKDFASWAPRESDPGASAYLASLVRRFEPVY